MVDIRVSAASGTSSDWAASTLILGIGQFAWETDTGILRIGDGVNLEPNLPVAANQNAVLLSIDDTYPATSGAAVWSALQSYNQDIATLRAAKAYADQAVSGALAGQQPRMDVCFQNPDGSYPNRPSAYCVFVFSTNGSTIAPTWLVTGVDVFFLRS